MGETKLTVVPAERTLVEALLFWPVEAKHVMAVIDDEDLLDMSARAVFAAARHAREKGQEVNLITVRRELNNTLTMHMVDDSCFVRHADERTIAKQVAAAIHEVIERSPYNRHRLDHPWSDSDVALDSFSSVVSRLGEIAWLWPGWLPRGMLTVLASNAGDGKSAIALEIARRVMVGGGSWPDGVAVSSSFVGGDLCVPPASASISAVSDTEKRQEGGHIAPPLQRGTGEAVILVDTESAESVVRRRVADWSVPVDRLMVFTSRLPGGRLARLALNRPEDFARLDAAVRSTGPALVIVDSLSGSHEVSENSPAIRRVLSKLAGLAADSGAAVLVVHHLRKRSHGETRDVTLDRLRGSNALAQIARCIWAIDRPDPQDRRRRLIQIKNNLVDVPEPVGFAFDKSGLAFSAPPVTPKVPSLVDLAAAFIREALTEGETPARKILAAGQEQGFSNMTVQRAAAREGVLRRREVGGGQCHWSLPREKLVCREC